MSTNYNITLTESALEKVRSLINKESNSTDAALRILVSGGGCSGFQYNFRIDRVENCDANVDDDSDIEDDNFSYDDEDEEGHEDELDASDVMVSDGSGKPILLVDSSSARFLKNSVVDYIEDLNGSGFVVKNPLAKSRCGCGNSFAI